MKKTNAASRRYVTLEYRDVPGKSVTVAGDFNDWRPEKVLTDRNNDGHYTCRLTLAPGEYQYKFQVDGEWRTDADNPNFIPNDFGSLNSVLVVKEK
ncbi:MAG: glycoside hydrolase [Lentisphaerae bacterium]|nr:glycoside hydrolase [Lentisphaerota bacterium]